MSRLAGLLEKLETYYGAPAAPRLNGPFEMILWEIVAYLADDAKRQTAFDVLRKRVGLTPEKILAAPQSKLIEVTRTGGAIAAEDRAGRLREAASLVTEEYGGDLSSVLKWPTPRAKKALMKFPMIGEPGAEKILMSCGALHVLALDSNGLRVLVRLGFGTESKSYSTTYRSVRGATLDEQPAGSQALTAAYHLLRQHGQQTCLRTSPACPTCPLRSDCPYFVASALR